MADNKHTRAFQEAMNEHRPKPTHMQARAFVSLFSEEKQDEITRLTCNYHNKSWVSNLEIYMYCKSNNIEPDRDKFDNYGQSSMDFKSTEHYADLKVGDEVEIDKRDAIVLSNKKEGKKLVVEFVDDDELKTIKY